MKAASQQDCCKQLVVLSQSPRKPRPSTTDVQKWIRWPFLKASFFLTVRKPLGLSMKIWSSGRMEMTGVLGLTKGGVRKEGREGAGRVAEAERARRRRPSEGGRTNLVHADSRVTEPVMMRLIRKQEPTDVGVVLAKVLSRTAAGVPVRTERRQSAPAHDQNHLMLFVLCFWPQSHGFGGQIGLFHHLPWLRGLRLGRHCFSSCAKNKTHTR